MSVISNGSWCLFYIRQVSAIINAPADRVMDLIVDSNRVAEYNK
jgi:hypothetical protein